MTRWEMLQGRRIAERRKTLDGLMAEVRKVAEEHSAVVFPFGSYAGGNVHSGSDLDVAFSGDLPPSARRQLIREVERLQERSGVGIDMIFEVESPQFFREVCLEHSIQ